MNILYDGKIYSSQATGGISRYFANLIERLPAAYSPFVTSTTDLGMCAPRHQRMKHVRFRGFGPKLVSRPAQAVWLSCQEKLLRPDLAHPTYYSLLTGRKPSSYSCPVVITVWDLIHEKYAATMDPDGRQAACKRAAVQAADHLICISENTKRDLLDWYEVDPDKVTVSYLASSLAASMTDPPTGQESPLHFVYVGSRATYKGFGRLLIALSRIARNVEGVRLMVVGPLSTPAEDRQIADLGLQDRIHFCGHVEDIELAALLGSSAALVYPSEYEGFGIPPLEAMACGAPVIASNTSSLPEVIGDAGMMFDPFDIDQLTECMLAVLDDGFPRAQVAARGREQSRKFSWERMAAETVSVYRSVVGR